MKLEPSEAMMAKKGRTKSYQDVNVYEAALQRLRYIYQAFDDVVVAFSGGKDSTAVLNLTIQVARELGRLPVKAVFFDEEAIHPPTIEYVERVRALPEVDLTWYCLPIKHRNACSNEQPYWYCWNPDEQHKWVRPLPDNVVTEHPLFQWGDSIPEFTEKLFDWKHKSVCELTGIRTQESIRRMRVMLAKVNDNYIARWGNRGKAHPIYDWSSEDVWRLVHQQNLDYNHTYDVFNRTKHYNNLLAQRVCPPFGEEPLRGLWLYAECFPELWHKMLYRVPGVATAWRYSNTGLYGVHSLDKPPSMTWKQFTHQTLLTYNEQERDLIASNVNSMLAVHKEMTAEEVPETEPHVLSGLCWRWLCKIVIKGDFKGRTKGKVTDFKRSACIREQLTEEDAVRKHGRPEYIAKYFKRRPNV